MTISSDTFVDWFVFCPRAEHSLKTWREVGVRISIAARQR
jgi:hypothetical protein